ncbi:MAG: hypothetical protein OXH78_09595, partial [Acidimicrobiaceae bacterium]|nr:hypothetical protein [Acidimicrobiaceae bacterium]
MVSLVLGLGGVLGFVNELGPVGAAPAAADECADGDEWCAVERFDELCPARHAGGAAQGSDVESIPTTAPAVLVPGTITRYTPEPPDASIIPRVITSYVSGFDRCRTVTYRCADTALCTLDSTVTLTCLLTQGYDDRNGDCEPPPGHSPYWLDESYSAEPVFFELFACDGRAVDAYGYFLDGSGFCGTAVCGTAAHHHSSTEHHSDGSGCHEHAVPADPLCGSAWLERSDDSHVERMQSPCPKASLTASPAGMVGNPAGKTVQFTVTLDEIPTAPGDYTISFSGTAVGPNGYFGAQPDITVRIEPNETTREVMVVATGPAMDSGDVPQTLTGLVTPAGASPTASITVLAYIPPP